MGQDSATTGFGRIGLRDYRQLNGMLLSKVIQFGSVLTLRQPFFCMTMPSAWVILPTLSC